MNATAGWALLTKPRNEGKILEEELYTMTKT
jgi:hypothetical protein